MILFFIWKCPKIFNIVLLHNSVALVCTYIFLSIASFLLPYIICMLYIVAISSLFLVYNDGPLYDILATPLYSIRSNTHLYIEISSVYNGNAP